MLLVLFLEVPGRGGGRGDGWGGGGDDRGRGGDGRGMGGGDGSGDGRVSEGGIPRRVLEASEEHGPLQGDLEPEHVAREGPRVVLIVSHLIDISIDSQYIWLARYP